MRATVLLILAIPCGAQEEKVSLKWRLQKEDRFTIQWNCAYQERMESGAQKGKVEERTDRREVEAEGAPTEAEASLALALKKVTWTFGTEEWEVVLRASEGTKPEVVAKIKTKDPSVTTRARAAADEKGAEMARLLEASYTLRPLPSPGRESVMDEEFAVMKGGAWGVNAPSLFNLAYVESRAPSAGVRPGQLWRESIAARMPKAFYGWALTDLELKVTALKPDLVAVKGSVSQPISEKMEHGATSTGATSFEHEFVFARAGHLQSSREEWSHKRVVDAPSPVWRRNELATLKQTLVVKKK